MTLKFPLTKFHSQSTPWCIVLYRVTAMYYDDTAYYTSMKCCLAVSDCQ